MLTEIRKRGTRYYELEGVEESDEGRTRVGGGAKKENDLL